ncbi:hypothetical protein ACE6H2_010908 [Prunus campanulata]
MGFINLFLSLIRFSGFSGLIRFSGFSGLIRFSGFCGFFFCSCWLGWRVGRSWGSGFMGPRVNGGCWMGLGGENGGCWMGLGVGA